MKDSCNVWSTTNASYPSKKIHPWCPKGDVCWFISVNTMLQYTVMLITILLTFTLIITY